MPLPFIKSSANISITVFEFRSPCGGSATSSNFKEILHVQPSVCWGEGEILEDWTGPGRGEGAWVRPGACRGGPGRALGESWERPGLPGGSFSFVKHNEFGNFAKNAHILDVRSIGVTILKSC